MHQLNHKTAISNSNNAFSAQFRKTMAWSEGSFTWPFWKLFLTIFFPSLSWIWWQNSTTLFPCNCFTTKSLTSTLTSGDRLSQPSCAATWLAYQVWHLSDRKHLEDLLKFQINVWKRSTLLIGTFFDTMFFFSSNSETASVVCPLKRS